MTFGRLQVVLPSQGFGFVREVLAEQKNKRPPGGG